MTSGQSKDAGPAGGEPVVRVLVVGPFQANCYFVTCPETMETVVIDPGAEAEALLAVVDEHHLKVVALVATHGHVDHVGAAATLKERTGAPFLVHEGDASMLRSPLLSLSSLLPGGAGAGKVTADRLLADGDEIPFGRLVLRVRHSPGHSPGGVCLLLDGPEGTPSLCFSGDTLFAGSVGRTDFPGGDWSVLAGSIRKVVYALPDDTVVLPGHGPETTVGREKRTNPFVTA
ncbi:MAG: MBL fold metallo-hydrolase [Bacillota bacterium]